MCSGDYICRLTFIILFNLSSFRGAISLLILVVVCSWVYARKWTPFLQGPRLSIVCGILSGAAWVTVLSPIGILITWGVRLVILLDHDTVGLAVILAGTALLLAFYAIMLWWRTQWQSSRMCAHAQYFFVYKLGHLILLNVLSLDYMPKVASGGFR